MGYGIKLLSSKGLFYSTDVDEGQFRVVLDYFVAVGNVNYLKAYGNKAYLSDTNLDVMVFGDVAHTVATTPTGVSLVATGTASQTSHVIVFAT